MRAPSSIACDASCGTDGILPDVRAFFLLLLMGCGGSDPNPLLGDASGNDAGVQPDQGMQDSPPPNQCSGKMGACSAPDVPAGWNPVALSMGACPSSFGTGENVGPTR